MLTSLLLLQIKKYKLDFKRCYLYLRIFIKSGKTRRKHKEALVFDKVMPGVPRKMMDLQVYGSGFVDSAMAFSVSSFSSIG